MMNSFKKVSIFFTALLFPVILFLVSTGKSQVKGQVDDCLQCHDKAWGITAQSQHPLIKEGKCRDCHQTYDTAEHRESIRPVDELCMECHTPEKMGRSHPIGAGVIDPNTAEAMTCVSTCHRPHGSDYPKQVPFKNNMDLCFNCHKDI